jgi:hypothetical protein
VNGLYQRMRKSSLETDQACEKEMTTKFDKNIPNENDSADSEAYYETVASQEEILSGDDRGNGAGPVHSCQ